MANDKDFEDRKNRNVGRPKIEDKSPKSLERMRNYSWWKNTSAKEVRSWKRAMEVWSKKFWKHPWFLQIRLRDYPPISTSRS